ncbi:zinc finger Y-chromosomal protein-like [Babylonia areolata]|uniref:zinc finger Y-chromosomal protein-like n=1 Tax=Babylonia areolata TaxID=304850 RepID=UPI003FD24FDF
MFALYSTLMTHERSHLPVRSPACRCHRCGARFLHEASLKAHLRRHEEEAEDGPESKPYQCGTCREWLSNEGSLKIHMQRHEGLDTARSTCTLCGTGFSSDAILRAHVRLHDAEPATRCVICIRPFRRSRVLLRHSDVHADERQNVCDTCEKRFPKVADGSWRRSQLLMPDERQFRCLYCGDRFSRLYQLAAHETGHTVLPPTSGSGDLSPPVVVVN